VSGRPASRARLDRRRLVTWFVALVAAVLLAYLPVWRGAPLWDDAGHLTRPELRSLDGLRRIWLEPGATQQYYPVLHSAFWIEHRLWGDAPLGYHLINIVLHGVAAFLVLVCLRRLAVGGAAFAAFAFALHPVHVESVAWISEQKNTLSAVFALASALCYLRFDGARRRGDYALASGFFVLALASKTATAPLPIALAAAIWWRHGRVERRHVAALAPLVVLGAAAGLLTAWVERRFVGATGADFQLAPIERVLVAGRAIVFYAATLVWPANLTFNYPRWQVDAAVWWQYLFPAGLAALVLALAWRARDAAARAALAALGAFVALLVPALGFVDVYPFRYSFVADHFQYLASIPAIAFASAAAAGGRLRPYAPVAGATILITFAIATWSGSRSYVDAETLYRATLGRNPQSWFAHNNLGLLLLERGRTGEAAAHLEAAVRLNPAVWEHHANLGLLRLRTGESAAAARHFEDALRLNPSYAEAHNNLGHLLFADGRLADAKSQFEEAIRLKPSLAEAHANLGAILEREGDARAALSEFQAAARLAPDLPAAAAGACGLLWSTGRDEEAIAACTAALSNQPASAESHYGLAVALFRRGRLDEAIVHFEESIRLRPDVGRTHNDLGVALAAKGQTAAALAETEESVRLQPGDPDASFNLANLLQRLGRPGDAIPHYRRALERKPDDPAIHNNLGGALQAAGRLDQAAAEFAEAIRLKPDFTAARENLRRLRAQVTK
jgi:protein O-mannosyl-transferase